MTLEPDFPAQPLPLDAVETPRFSDWKTAPGRWELLCGRLLDRDERYTAADLFELRGFKQYGLDALAGSPGGGQVGLSAKCYEAVTAADIRDWSDDFIKHRDGYWSSRDVRIFILAVAAPNITSGPNRDQIVKEKARFEALGMTYEVWGPEPVYDRLRCHADLVMRFLGVGWRDLIFGPAPATTAVIDAALLGQLASAQSMAADQVRARITEGRERLLEGDHAAVESLLATITAATVWPLLPPAVQAETLRLAAGLALDGGRIGEAESHATAAAVLGPDNGLLAVRIIENRKGTRPALEALGAPTTAAGRRYEVSLWLALGEVETAWNKLAALGDGSDDLAETDRLRAFVHLGRHDFEGALACAEASLARAPRRLNVRLAHAVVLYAASLSPSTPPSFILNALAPPRNLVRQDSVSRERRRAALEALRGLNETPLAGRIKLEDWILACLAAQDPDGDEVLGLVRARLAADTLDLTAAFAAMSLEIGIDLAPTAEALGAKLDSGEADAQQVRSFAQIQLNAASRPEVADRLEQAVGGLQEEARNEAQTWISGLRTVTPFEPIAQLTGWLDEEPPDLRALDLAGDLAGDRRWADLGPFVERLAAFRTPVALRLATYTLHHTADPATVLAFIDDHADAYPDRQVPLDVRRVRLSSLSALHSPQAIKVSKALVLETGAAEDRKHLVGLLLAEGAVQAALPVIRRLLADGAVSSGDAIRYSVAVIGEDRNLARSLWRRAMKDGVSDAFLLHALTQGYRLGLDAEVAPLMPRLAARARSGADDVWEITIDDLPEALLKRRSEVEDVQDKLLDGKIPIHLAPRGGLGSLAGTYHLEADAAAPGPQPMVLLRHGSRPADLQAPTPWAEWQLVLDPTALLVADHLDLLDEIEALDKPTLIGRSLLDVLYAFEQDAAPGQPARIDAARALLAAVAEGRLRQSTGEPQAVRVLHEREAGELGPTVAEVEAVLDGAAPEDFGLAEGARLSFDQGTLDSIALGGRLEAALVRFQCEISADDLRDAGKDIRAAETGERLAARIRGLRERLALGLTMERYAYLPDTPDPQAGEEDEGTDEEDDDRGAGTAVADPVGRPVRRRSPLEACLMSSLAAPSAPGRMIWIDDRMASGYLRSQDNLIVTVVEVLNALRAAGRFTEAERRERLLRLRRGGAAFLPMEADEVLEPLDEAGVRDGRLVETPTLAVLRRNLASAARLDRRLIIGRPDGRPDEQPFVSSLLRLAEECLRAVWSDPATSKEVRIARSDWIWENLRIERCVRPLPVDQPAASGNAVLASVTLAGLLTLGSQIDGGAYLERRKRRKAYIDWLETRALRPRSGRTHEAWTQRMVEQFRALYEGTFEIEVDPSDMDLVRKLRHDEIMALPERFRRRILDQADFAEAVGMRVDWSTTAGANEFESQAFWRACARAVRSGRTTAQTLDGRRVPLTWRDGGLHVGGETPTRVGIPFADALTGRGAARRSAIRRYIKGLEIFPELAAETTARADRAATLADLADAFQAARDGVVEAHYACIDEAFRKGGNIRMEVLFPTPACQALHALRLTPRGTFPQRVRRAWKRLEAEKGVQTALLRLGGLPLDLADLIPDGGSAFPSSPVVVAHRSAAACRRDQDHATAVRRLLALPADASALLLDLVEWSRRAYSSDLAWRALPAEDRLALCWCHAHRLMTILMGLTDDFTELRERFASHTPQVPIERDLTGAPWGADRAEPSLTRESSLLYHGLAYAMDGASPWLELPLELQAGLASRLVAVASDYMGSEAGLLLAGPRATNILGTWLDRVPTGLFHEDLGPAAYRRRQTDAVLAEIDGGDLTPPVWQVASLLARGGCETEVLTRYRQAVDRLNPAALAETPDGRLVCRVALDGLSDAPLSDDVLRRFMHDMATGTAKVSPGPIRLNDSAAGEVIEPLIAALIAGARNGDPAQTLERLRMGAVAAAYGWPALATPFRNLFGRWYGQADPSADSLWAAFIEFRAWP